MENLTGGTPPVRPLPCVVPCKLYFRFALNSRAFAFFREDMNVWFVESGTYQLEIGQSSQKIVMKTEVDVQGVHTNLQQIDLFTPLGDVLSLPGAIEILEAYGVCIDKQEQILDNENEKQILQAHYEYMPLRCRLAGLSRQQYFEMLERLRKLIH